MKKELEYFWIGESYGGNQEWFTTFMMRIGGCAAETACDSCVYFAKILGKKHLYPYNLTEIKKEEYVAFSNIMKPFLTPRLGGVSRLELYTEGFEKYLDSVQEKTISLETLSGHRPLEEAKKEIKSQIDKNIPIPCLLLKHKNPKLQDYTWHWFLLIGYDDSAKEKRLMVKTVTYSKAEWICLDELWDTGYAQRGGLILYRLASETLYFQNDNHHF